METIRYTGAEEREKGVLGTNWNLGLVIEMRFFFSQIKGHCAHTACVKLHQLLFLLSWESSSRSLYFLADANSQVIMEIKAKL